MKKYGYLRVSTNSQEFDRQIAKLQDLGLDEIFKEKISGTTNIENRQELNRLFNILKKGDILYVENFSRLSRELKHSLELCDKLEQLGVRLISVTEDFDRDTYIGKYLSQMMMNNHELEKNISNDRVRAGILEAKKRGVRFGRPQVSPEKIDTAIKMYHSGNFSIKEITITCGVGKTTLYDYLKKHKNNQGF